MKFDTNSKTDKNLGAKKDNGDTTSSLYNDKVILAQQQANVPKSISEVIDFLTANGYPALPVAPRQDPARFPARYKDKSTGKWRIRYESDGITPKPRFTGKNPSYIDRQGIPQTLNHREYQDKLPTAEEQALWFSHASVGVGTLGGWQNTTWIDLDVDKFDSLQNCSDRAESWIKTNQLQDTWIERTHSGGYRVAVKVEQPPSFTNFSLDGIGGLHRGESLGAGRFTVLAPTIGNSGNAYQNLNLAVPMQVESLESIGIFPSSVKADKEFKGFKSSQKTEKTEKATLGTGDVFAHSLKVEKLLSAKALGVLAGDNVLNDRSASLTLLIQELAGWQAWLADNGIGIQESLDTFVYSAGSALGIDDSRISRIIDSANVFGAKPSIHYQSGDSGCWKKIKQVDKKLFDKCCPEEFKKDVTPETNSTVPTNYEERVAEVQRKLHTLSYPADLVCDPDKKYLPDLVGKIPTKGVVILKSPKGSGKSHQIKLIKQQRCGHWEDVVTYPEVPEIQPEQLDLLAPSKSQTVQQPITKRVWHPGLGMNFISINARIALGRGQAILWEFTYIGDADIGDDFGTKLSTESILENIDQIGLCADSLAKLKRRDWSNTLVVMDEIELDLNHVVTSSTCRDTRSEILQVLEDKIKETLDNGGMLIGADADVTDVTVNYLKAIAPNHPPFIVQHDFKGDPWEISFCADKRDQILSQIDDHLADPNCEPIAITLDNQKEAESLDMVLRRKYPYLNKEIGGLIRIDSKTTQQDFGKEFVERPNENILKYQPKVLIYTPSLGVGCSINVHHFGCVYGLFFGNVEPREARQMLARVRPSVPRVVWAKVRAGNNEDTPNSYLPEEIKRRMYGKHDTAMMLLETALTQARAEVVASGIDDPEDKDITPVFLETIKKMQGADGSWNNPHADLYCNQIARRNFSQSQFAVQLRQELIEDGHIVTDIDGDEKTNTGEDVREAKEEIKRRDSAMTAAAKDISFKDAQDLKRKAARTQEEEHKITKAFLKHDLPDLELSADFIYKAIHKDHGRWLAQTKLFWLLHNPEALVNKDNLHWKSKLSQFSKGVTCLWDVKVDAPKIEAIQKSGVLDWIDLDDLEKKYSSSSPEGQEFLTKCLAAKKELRNVFNMTIKHDSSPIKIAKKLLDKIGVGLKYASRNKEIKYYKLNEKLMTDSDRNAVFDSLNLKWKNEQAKMAVSDTQQPTQRMTGEDCFLIKNGVQSPHKLTAKSLCSGTCYKCRCKSQRTTSPR